ncbi:MAG: peptide chain release factor N(5)-glutamine methyltransferase [Pseudomonadota bacterium]
MSAPTVAAVLATAVERLAASESPRLDAEWLLADVLDWPRSRLRAFPEVELTPEQHHAFTERVERRAVGEPVAYLTGWHGFRELELTIAPGVLIPRPETEELVDHALALLAGRDDARVVDIGTGSGAIALALVRERPDWSIHATEASEAAITIALENTRRLGLAGRLHPRHGEWLADLHGPWDLVVSNPPYIPEDDPHLDRGDVAFEPRVALAAGPDGLDALRELARRVPPTLAPGGWLLVEHGHDQADAVAGLFREAGLVAVDTLVDLAGHARFTRGRRRPDTPDPRAGSGSGTPRSGRR